ncbi:PLD nuclease N-terminal domain-containing protein [Pseudomonas sp. JQ170C]|uniref:PLD nuclease N-terminal domain-containing protein n=2 Tax=unclassified Pseudomonas TaxID=196821 RepID=UPI002D79807A|nr:PLD nuclease N-terminal domain-containing protein [Pseudomonas sp. 170C]WRO78196.1 PLD nuclease N-terminal domain-containing protein [Pseudomonas sp. 170C]
MNPDRLTEPNAQNLLEAYMENGHIWISLAVLITLVELWAIKRIIGSKSRADRKMLWIVFIVFVPVLGLIVWAAAGPKSSPGVPISREG